MLGQESRSRRFSRRRAKSTLSAERRALVISFEFFSSPPVINAARVAGRVMEGGHSVPIDKIVSRFVRSTANLSGAIHLADRVYVFDNSVDDVDAQLCARTQDGMLRKVYQVLPQWVSDAVDALKHHAEFVDLRAA